MTATFSFLFPTNILRPRDRQIDLAARTATPGSALTGFAQVASSDAGVWVATLGQILVQGPAQIRLFRQIDALLEGMLNTLLVPACEGSRRPYPTGITAADYEPEPHSDDTLFSDGSGYLPRQIIATLDAAAALGATQVTIAKDTIGEIEGGMRFSIGHWLYEVRYVDSQDDTTAVLKIRPPLRVAAEAGDFVDFDWPHCLMRLASDQEMNLSLELSKRGTKDVSFVEAIAPEPA